jgi:hypothetical protein
MAIRLGRGMLSSTYALQSSTTRRLILLRNNHRPPYLGKGMSEDNNPQTSGTQNDTSVSAGKKVRQKARELRPREVLRAMGEQGPVTMAELK